MGIPAGDRGDHYFTEAPTSVSRPASVRLRARGLEVRLATDRGTFSPTRVDPGTQFLIELAPHPPGTGRFVDLGCGYGPMAVVLASASPAATVVAVDVNQRARDLTRANAETLGLTNIEVTGPDVDTGPVDLIWSNPPIRIGKPALHHLLVTWLGRLSSDGRAILVVNRHLGADSLQRWLSSAGFPTTKLASKKGYRLLDVRRA